MYCPDSQSELIFFSMSNLFWINIQLRCGHPNIGETETRQPIVTFKKTRNQVLTPTLPML